MYRDYLLGQQSSVELSTLSIQTWWPRSNYVMELKIHQEKMSKHLRCIMTCFFLLYFWRICACLLIGQLKMCQEMGTGRGRHAAKGRGRGSFAFCTWGTCSNRCAIGRLTAWLLVSQLDFPRKVMIIQCHQKPVWTQSTGKVKGNNDGDYKRHTLYMMPCQF